MIKLYHFRQNSISCRNFCSRLNVERIADFPQKYETKNAETFWNNVWKQNNFFNPLNNKSLMTMILPPPNVTGALHLGHALTITIQDVLARWNRMKGVSVLWVPGLDHAGIATQVMVEKHLKAKNGVTRLELGKENFLKCVEDWKNEKGHIIENQLRNLGSTLDWSKQYFTMSKDQNNAVSEAFVILNERNLLYRNNSLVNWSPALRSTISEIEVDYLPLTKKTELQVPGYDRKISFGEIIDIVFKVKDSKDEIVVSTTRVETLLGDVAIAVHPEDSRHSQFIGQQVWHPLREVFIPVIADSFVKQDFGTGAVKITPGHSIQDLEIARRHNLEEIEVIGEDGIMNKNAKQYEGYPRFVARYKILNELKNKGILKNIKDHAMLVPICSRSGDIIEYIMKEQWYIKTKQMAEKVVDSVKNKELKLDPERHEKLWYDKLNNIRDWCVSRQLWWGHQVPAYSCEINSEIHWIVAKSIEEARQISKTKFGSADVRQDNDVLDTWFSAALLPLSAMGWPDKKHLQFYPLSLMETGQDILFYWVAKMAMLCTELSGVLPFKEILLHGILCDSHKRKMSKSLGNVILPEFIINGISLSGLKEKAKENLESGLLDEAEFKKTISVNAKSFPQGIPECGTDSLRFTLCSHNIKEDRINFAIEECKTFKHFCNKIWQASKYVLMVTDDVYVKLPENLSTVDRWILSRLELMVEIVNDSLEQRNFHRAVSAMRQFFHYEFCDFFLEATKIGLESSEEDIIKSHRYCLITCLETFLRTVAPFMPYLSEELYSRLAKKLPAFSSVPSIMKTQFPTTKEINRRDCELEEQFDQVIKNILVLRDNLSRLKKNFVIEAHLVLENKHEYEFYHSIQNFIITSSKIDKIEIFYTDDYTVNDDSTYIQGAQCKMYYLLTDKNTGMITKTTVNNNDELQKEEKPIKKRTKI
ncbi:valine--tRNA ligase-like [Chelonus insularis]|uniref:valine--tRNA ligase-like n=1 Tax=Chelonus insularis TaxID=460826 RepID=UPI0015888B81|nr:valine--tRNA ligase-like [Chelonus insularis]